MSRRSMVPWIGALAAIALLVACETPPDEMLDASSPGDASADASGEDDGGDGSVAPDLDGGEPLDAEIPFDAGIEPDAAIDPDAGDDEDAGMGSDAGCTSDEACDDGDACTDDSCQSGVCVHDPVDVDDGNACTVDSCDPSTGAPVHTPVDVDDGNVCTVDACDPSTGTVTHTSIPNCCIDATDCASGVCTANECAAPSCSDGVKNGNETAIDCGGDCGGCGLGAACGTGSDCASGFCAGGVCVECESASHCPGIDTECQVRTCSGNVCGIANTTAGTPSSAQTPGDCRRLECDGNGGLVDVPDDADVPANASECTVASCDAGTPVHTPRLEGDACTENGGAFCDGAGACVQCVSAADCPVAADECSMATCTDGFCGFAFVPEGVPVSAQDPGDCAEVQCDGNGGTISVPLPTDVPVDGNACTDDVCNSGVPENPPAAPGTLCSEDGGVVCDGAGQCVGAPSVVSTTPGDFTSVLASTQIAVTFSEAMDEGTLTAQTTAGACTGSIQVSLDDFTTCIGFASGLAAMSEGDTVATLTPAPGLMVNRTYKLRVTRDAQSAAGIGLAAVYTMADGFVTGSPPACEGGVVIAEVYGGGGNSGAVYDADYVVLHNTSASSVTIDGWSLQYGSAAGSTWNNRITLSGMIAPGAHFLIRTHNPAGNASGDPVPMPDQVGTNINMGGSGKIALVSNSDPLAGACPLDDADLVDFVGFGTATCYEGSAAAPAGSNSTALIRTACQDTDDNRADFTVGTPTPRSSASPAEVCACPALALNESGDALEADFCNVQTPHSLTVAAGDTSEPVFGRIHEAGLTDAPGGHAEIVAQLGYGPATANPQYEPWTWVDATFETQSDDDDEYQATLTPPAAGEYRYAYRFSRNGGVSWTVCDIDGAGSSGDFAFDLASLPVLTVTP